MVLLTRRANAELARAFAARGQRFDAVLLLNVLHWLPDHRAFLTALAPLADTFFLEHPEPSEQGVGEDRLRKQIDPLDAYLADCFAGRPVERLGWVEGLRAGQQRAIWRVGPGGDRPAQHAAALDLVALAQANAAWPPRGWWWQQLERATSLSAGGGSSAEPGAWQLTPRGLVYTGSGLGPRPQSEAQRSIRRIAARGLYTPRSWCYHQARRIASGTRRRWRSVWRAALGG